MEARYLTVRSAGLYRAVVSTCNSVGGVAVVTTASPYNHRLREREREGKRDRGGLVVCSGRVGIRGVAQQCCSRVVNSRDVNNSILAYSIE
jgi:hypothetical protein